MVNKIKLKLNTFVNQISTYGLIATIPGIQANQPP